MSFLHRHAKDITDAAQKVGGRSPDSLRDALHDCLVHSRIVVDRAVSAFPLVRRFSWTDNPVLEKAVSQSRVSQNAICQSGRRWLPRRVLQVSAEILQLIIPFRRWIDIDQLCFRWLRRIARQIFRC
jgi:hypothetical protein